MQVDLDEAKTQLLELAREANEGTEVVLTIEDRPLAKIVRISPSPGSSARRPGTARGLIEMSEDFDEPLEDFAAYT